MRYIVTETIYVNVQGFCNTSWGACPQATHLLIVIESLTSGSGEPLALAI